jgi:hypothetical protein
MTNLSGRRSRQRARSGQDARRRYFKLSVIYALALVVVAGGAGYEAGGRSVSVALPVDLILLFVLPFSLCIGEL